MTLSGRIIQTPETLFGCKSLGLVCPGTWLLYPPRVTRTVGYTLGEVDKTRKNAIYSLFKSSQHTSHATSAVIRTYGCRSPVTCRWIKLVSESRKIVYNFVGQALCPTHESPNPQTTNAADFGQLPKVAAPECAVTTTLSGLLFFTCSSADPRIMETLCTPARRNTGFLFGHQSKRRFATRKIIPTHYLEAVIQRKVDKVTLRHAREGYHPKFGLRASSNKLRQPNMAWMHIHGIHFG